MKSKGFLGVLITQARVPLERDFRELDDNLRALDGAWGLLYNGRWLRAWRLLALTNFAETASSSFRAMDDGLAPISIRTHDYRMHC